MTSSLWYNCPEYTSYTMTVEDPDGTVRVKPFAGRPGHTVSSALCNCRPWFPMTDSCLLDFVLKLDGAPIHHERFLHPDPHPRIPRLDQLDLLAHPVLSYQHLDSGDHSRVSDFLVRSRSFH
jgi:hypothetical protein